jgi:hypothetical protein
MPRTAVAREKRITLLIGVLFLWFVWSFSRLHQHYALFLRDFIVEKKVRKKKKKA